MTKTDHQGAIKIAAPQLSWALDLAKVDSLYLTGFKGEGIRIGHLDTGIHLGLRDLFQQIEHSCIFDLNGFPQENDKLDDDNGHGTHTASLLVGSSRTRTYIGVAPKAKLVTGKVLEGGAAIVRILRGLDWLGEQKVPLAYLCAGLPNRNPVFGPMLRSLREDGMLVVCPIGNAGNGNTMQPGDDTSVLSVGAIDRQGKVPGFSGSRRGAYSTQVLAPDILAPGVEVPCATRTGGRATYNGTSMSAAIVAGVAALLLEAVPGASADDLYDAICYGANPLNADTKKHARCGILNAEIALDYLRKHNNQENRPRPERPPLVRPGWCDPRLNYQLTRADRDDSLMAVYVLQTDSGIAEWEQRCREILAPVFQKTVPDSIEYLPRGRAVIISAPPAVHKALIANSSVLYASAADAGRILLPNK
jgi:hypothetical protein